MIRVCSIKKIANTGILDESSFQKIFNLKIDEEKHKIAKRVLIKGNNATGKTTLSNIFRLIENRHDNEKCKYIFNKIKSYDKDNAEIEIQLNEGCLKYNFSESTWEGAPNPVIKVFNEDFVKENVDFTDFAKNKLTGAIEIDSGRISKEKIEYEEAMENYKTKQEHLNIDIKNLEKGIKTKNNILKELGLRPPQEDYQTYIDKSTGSQYTLKYIKEQLKKEIDNYRQLKNPPFISRPGKSDIDVDFFCLFFLKQYFYRYEEAEKAAIEKINEISDNQRQWILEGLEYQGDKKDCFFCGQKLLDYSRIKLYEKYRDSKINEVRHELKKLNEHELNLIIDMIEGLGKIQESVYNVNLKLYNINDNIEELFSEIYNLQSTINYLQGIIYNKIENDKIEPKELVENLLDKFKFQIKKMYDIYDLLDKYDEETRKVTNRRNALSAKIKEYSKEKFYLENKDGIIASCVKSKDVETAKSTMEKKKEAFLKLEEERKIEILIIKRLFLHLGIYDYDIDKDFNLRWRNKAYTDKKYSLSGGEVSAIAFSYFIASIMVELTEEQKNNLIIWIDDPVCSIDYPRIFSIVTLISDIPNLLMEKKDENGLINRNGSENTQIIISTHNDLLFNFLLQSNQFLRREKSKVFELYKRNNRTLIRVYKKQKETIYYNKLEEIIDFAEMEPDKIDGNGYLFIPNYLRYVLEQLKLWINPNPKYDMIHFLEKDLGFTQEESGFLKKLYDIYSHVVPAIDEERIMGVEEIHKCCKLIKGKIGEINILSGQIDYIAATKG